MISIGGKINKMIQKKINLDKYELTPVARKAFEIQQNKGINIESILEKLQIKIREERAESMSVFNINLNSPKLASIAMGSKTVPYVQKEPVFDDIGTPSYLKTRLSHGNGGYSLRPVYRE